MSIQVYLISGLNFDYTKKGGKIAFPANPKHQHRVSHYREHDCKANYKKNGDFYKYTSLSNFTNKF